MPMQVSGHTQHKIIDGILTEKKEENYDHLHARSKKFKEQIDMHHKQIKFLEEQIDGIKTFLDSK